MPIHRLSLAAFLLISICAATSWAGGRAPSTASKPATTTAPTTHAATGRGPAADLDLDVTLSTLSMKLPTDWALNVGGKVFLEAHPGTPDKDTTGTFQASLSVTQGTLTGGTGKADIPLATGQQANAAKQEANYQPVEKPAPITIAGLSGVKFGGTFKRGTLELRSRTYILAQNNQVYIFTFTSLNSKWAAYQALIDRSVTTFVPKSPEKHPPTTIHSPS